MTERRERRSFSEEFKNQMVQLYNIGKPRDTLIKKQKIHDRHKAVGKAIADQLWG